MRGEIKPSKEATHLVESLESRMGRTHLKDSVSATKHFLHSLKTPNDELRYKNSFDHVETYRKLPPAERDFVYLKAVEQKDLLESKLLDNNTNTPSRDPEFGRTGEATVKINSFRESLKSDLIELFTRNAGSMTSGELSDRTSLLIEKNLEGMGMRSARTAGVTSLSRDLGENVLSHLGQGLRAPAWTKEHDRETITRGGPIHRIAAGNVYER
jgi:hypothetical protein